MPFHARGHKAKPPAKSLRFQMRYRLLLVAIGAFFILGGVTTFAYRGFFGMNRLHQPVYATDAIAGGALIALCALIPSSWLERWASMPESKPADKKPPRP